MTGTERDFLIEKINTVIMRTQKAFVTNLCLKILRLQDGYRPSFSHFEVIYSGLLPVTLPCDGGFRETELCPDDVLYLVPNAWVGRGMGTERELLVINLHNDGIECYFSHRSPDYPEGHFPRVSYFTSTPIEPGGQYILKSFEYYSRKENPQMQKHLFKVFLELVKNSIGSDKGGSNSKSYYNYKMLLQFVRDNCCANINREAAAYEFGVSPDYVTHLFQKYGPFSFNHIMQQCRMEEAVNFLGQNKMNINQVAALCGFGETSYFIKVFRRFYGMTPAEYRLHHSGTA